MKEENEICAEDNQFGKLCKAHRREKTVWESIAITTVDLIAENQQNIKPFL